jgi:hypothetical protein
VISRYARFSGTVTVQTTRQTNEILPTSINNTYSDVNLTYSHARAFGVNRLTFFSSLTAFSRAPVPVLVAPSNEQGQATWENSLSHTIGQLSSEFKIYLSKDGFGQTQTLIWLSLRRWF